MGTIRCIHQIDVFTTLYTHTRALTNLHDRGGLPQDPCMCMYVCVCARARGCSGAWCNFDKVNVRRSVERPSWYRGRSTKMGCNRCYLTSFVASAGKLAFLVRRLNRETRFVESSIVRSFFPSRETLWSSLRFESKSRTPIRRDKSKKQNSSLIYLLI